MLGDSESLIDWVLSSFGIDSRNKLNKPIHIASRIGDISEGNLTIPLIPYSNPKKCLDASMD